MAGLFYYDLCSIFLEPAVWLSVTVLFLIIFFLTCFVGSISMLILPLIISYFLNFFASATGSVLIRVWLNIFFFAPAARHFLNEI